ncbi:microcystin dependent protein [Vibrio maritimus]|uniref:Microcystin dependent protein n=1 Tax=Vibrio maritimus TaxID=990268 RepID=A0A090T7M5_9VIBR|nr:microcystin dependent protein [Vibrio maritimus]
MTTSFQGEVIAFGGNFAIANYSMCNGSLISISQNESLYSLLGTTYGGDGRVSFGLPELRGRVQVNQGQGPGLTHRIQGQMLGVQSQVLTEATTPSHSHPFNVQNSAPTTNAPANNLVGKLKQFSNQLTGTNNMNANSIGDTGASNDFSISQPTTVLNFLIAIQGIYPSRN